jgi:predicted DCC family thiol-disulfide oxidoreductase YuxK
MKKQSKIGKTIIYDDQCPMCRIYTKAFIKTGLLEQRIPFSTIQAATLEQLDASRACDEIPLIDANGGHTLYGIDSLVYLLSQRFPFIQSLFRVKAVDWFFRRFYKFISYNRKVIMPAARVGGYDCSPAFNLKYRLLYIVFAMLLSTWFSYAFVAGAAIYTDARQQMYSLGIAGGKWMLLGLAALLALKGERRIELLGQLATVCLAGSLVLLPGVWLHNNYTFFILLVVSVLLMTKELYRRVALMQMSGWWWLWMLVLVTAVSGQYFLLR